MSYPRWHKRSHDDGDTHWGALQDDGFVAARCSAVLLLLCGKQHGPTFAACNESRTDSIRQMALPPTGTAKQVIRT